MGSRRLTLLATLLAVSAGCGGTAPTAAEQPVGPIPDVIAVVCGNPGAVVVAPHSVRPRRDGVHLAIVNQTGTRLSYTLRYSDGAGGGGDAPAGETEVVWPAPVGHTEVVCYGPAGPADPSKLHGEPFQVVDPDGIWLSPALQCKHRTSFTMNGVYAEGTLGEKGVPAEIARRELEKQGLLRNDDSVEPAGYPEQEQPVVRVVRDGRTIASLAYVPDGHSGWLQETFSGCTGAGLEAGGS